MKPRKKILLIDGQSEIKSTMNKVKFAKRIIELRKARGLNREELAKNLRMSYGHLNNIELGTRLPSTEVIIRLARELHVPSGYLFQQLDDESPYQEFFDTEAYVALPYTLSQEDKEEIRDYVAFKASRKSPSGRLAFENEAETEYVSQLTLPQNKGFYLAG